MAASNREIAMILKLKDEASVTITQVNDRVRELNKEIRNIEIGNEDYRQYADQLKTLRGVQQEFNQETGRSVGWLAEQRREQRDTNFLFKQGKDVIGAAAVGLSLFSGTVGQSSEEMKHLNNAINQGFVAFQGLSFLLSAAGPWGIAIAGAGGLAAAIASMASESDNASEEVRKLHSELIKLQVALGELPKSALWGDLNKQLLEAENNLKNLTTPKVVSLEFGGKPVYDGLRGTAEQIEAARVKVAKLRTEMKGFATEDVDANVKGIERFMDTLDQVDLQFSIPTVNELKLKPGDITPYGDTIKSLEERYRDLNAQIARTATSDPGFDRMKTQADRLKNQIEQLKAPTLAILPPSLDPKVIEDQAKVAADIQQQAHKEGLDKQLSDIDDWEKKSVQMAHENEALITQIHEAAAEARKEASLRNWQDEFAQWAGLASQAISLIDRAVGQSAAAEVSRVQREMSNVLREVDKRKTAEIKSIEDRKKADIRAIDDRLKHENLSAEERKKLEVAKFDLESRYAEAKDAADAKFTAEREKRETEYQKKLADAKRAEFEAHKDAAVIQAVVDTASAVVEALPNIPLSIVVGALGAAQVAVIASQPTPEFHSGTDDKTVREILNAPPSNEFLIKVRGGETIRTEEQEARIKETIRSHEEIQRIIQADPGLKETLAGNAFESAVSNDQLPSTETIRELRTLINQVPNEIPRFHDGTGSRSVEEILAGPVTPAFPGRLQAPSFGRQTDIGRSSQTTQNSYVTYNSFDLTLNIETPIKNADDIRRELEKAMRQMGITDINKLIVNQRGGPTS